MNQFDTGKRGPGCCFGLEAEHRPDPALDTAVILLDGIVHVFAGSDSDGPSGPPQPVLRIALHDGHAVGLAAVNGDPLRLAMASQGLAQKALRSLEIAVCGEVELDRIAIVVDGAIRIKPRAFDLYISLVEVPFPRDIAFSPIEAVKQLGAEMQNPAMHSGMIQRDAALGHLLLQIAQAQIISLISSHT